MRVLSDGGEGRGGLTYQLASIFFSPDTINSLPSKICLDTREAGSSITDQCYLQLAGPDAIKLDH